MSAEQKLIVVGLMKARKEILFYPDNSKRVRDGKENAWREIVDICKSEYGFDATNGHNHFNYLRDTIWFNWKRTATKKAERTEMGDDEMTEVRFRLFFF